MEFDDGPAADATADAAAAEPGKSRRKVKSCRGYVNEVGPAASPSGICHVRRAGLYSRALDSGRQRVAYAARPAITRVMSVNDQRPVNLALGTIHFPLPAIVSLLHRISGFALFGMLPPLLWAWQQSLASPAAFHTLIDALPFKLAVILVLAGVIYHLVAGIKHLLMDAGIGETLAGARRFSWATLILSAALIAVTVVWIW